MKVWFESFCSAFSMYSVIPVPRVRWSPESRRYALCFFPLVGAVIAALLLLWYWVSVRLELAAGLFAAVAVLLPILVSGGIHMDGFMDTVDALSSHAWIEKKLEILQDPHVGAFGVLGCVGSLLLQFGLWQQVYVTPWLVALPAMGAILSRSLNGLSIATFPCARPSGLVHAFADSASRTAAVTACLLFAAAACLICLDVSLLWGGMMAVFSVLYFMFHRRFCMWEFGGNTGDLAGFLLHNVEMLSLVLAAIGGVLA